MYEGMGMPGDKQTVVIDIGTAYTKCGFTGEPAPRCIIRTEVTCPDTKQTRQVHDYSNPEELHQLLVSFIHGLFFKHLLVSPKDRRVVIVESLLETTLFRDTLAKALFLHFEVSSVLFAPSHLVALCTLGVQTALVLDVGFKEAVLFPIIEGVPVLHAWQAQPLGGQAVHESVRSLLAEQAKAAGDETLNVDQLPESVIEDIKIRLCFVSTLERSQSALAPPPSASYNALGAALVVPGAVRERAFDVLFAQDGEQVSVATICLDAIAKCAVDSRRALAENILVAGGTAMAPGFSARLRAEMLRLAVTPKYVARLAVETFKFHRAPARDNYTCWMGGSIFGGTELLVSRSLSREAYVRIGSVPDWSRIDQPAEKEISYGF